jgi:hypothetical protein
MGGGRAEETWPSPHPPGPSPQNSPPALGTKEPRTISRGEPVDKEAEGSPNLITRLEIEIVTGTGTGIEIGIGIGIGIEIGTGTGTEVGFKIPFTSEIRIEYDPAPDGDDDPDNDPDSDPDSDPAPDSDPDGDRETCWGDPVVRFACPLLQRGTFSFMRSVQCRQWLLLPLVWVLIAGTVPTGAAPHEGSTAAADSLGRWRPAGFPILAYAPETGLMYGGWLQAIKPSVSGRRDSQLALWLTGTQNRQAEAGLRPELWFAGERWQVNGELSYSNWPDSFYGIGPRSQSADETAFTAERLKLLVLAGRRFAGHGPVEAFAGLLLAYDRESFLQMDAAFPRREDDGEQRGLGVELRLDSRDAGSWPRRGMLHRLRVSSRGGPLGGDHRYRRWTLDLRGYRPLAGGVLAGQALIDARGGEPGFRQLARLGEALRAYADNRYLDRALAAGRLEWRRPLFGRAGLVLFAGAGAIGPALDRLGDSPLRPSLGAGGRWEMIPGTGLNLRIDAALGAGSSGLHIRLGEEF